MRYKAVIHTGFPSTLKHEAAAREAGKRERNNPARLAREGERAAWRKISKRKIRGKNSPFLAGKSELFWGRQARQLQAAHLAQLKEAAAV